MSEIPALRDALVGAASRRVRRRRRRALALVGWTAVAVAAAAVFVLLAGPAPRERERPAITPQPQDALVRGFSVFRRPATAADALPADARGDGRDIDARLALDEDGSRVWLAAMTQPKIEGFGGRRELCAVVRGKAGTASTCNGSPGSSPGTLTLLPRRNAPDSVLFVLPDGARDPQVTLSSDFVLAPKVQGNVALAVPHEPPVGASYTTAAGVRQIARWHDLHARGWSPAKGCPKLEPLPPGAEDLARRAALLAVDRIYPWIQEASVTGVSPVGPGLCTRAVTDRSLMVELHLTPFKATRSASLTQGRLLVGMRRGEMTVWMINH
jgi:hypothetical protein